MGSGIEGIVEGLKTCGISVAASLPDTWLGPLLERLTQEGGIRHVPVCREEEGLAICSGVVLGGEHSVLVAQNAGILSSGTGLLTLVQMNRLPLLLLVSYRGSTRDPLFYHVPKGLRTEPFLQALGVPYSVAESGRDLTEQVQTGFHFAQESQGPFVLLLHKEHLS
jgi:sulfopyruvate decarboxylase subunit alpha